MAEYIAKAAAEKFIEDGLNDPDETKRFGHDAIEIMAEIHFMDAADVVPVVRCKDCKHCGKGECGLWCTLHDDGYARDDYFCAAGERRDGGT